VPDSASTTVDPRWLLRRLPGEPYREPLERLANPQRASLPWIRKGVRYLAEGLRVSKGTAAESALGAHRTERVASISRVGGGTEGFAALGSRRNPTDRGAMLDGVIRHT